MEKTFSKLKLENEDYFFKDNQAGFRCSGCNGTFQKPILATISSRGCVQTYYACPRCLSKISVVKDDKNEEGKETSISMKNVKKAVVKHEDNAMCKHFLGYLKKRSKDVPIPDDCLTCDKMIECLMH